MKVGIIDCIVDTDLIDLKIQKQILKQRRYIYNVKKSSNSHSALIINVLEKYSLGKLNYYLYEIMEETRGGSCELLIKAMDDAISDSVSVIILSLTVLKGDFNRLWKICKKAKEKNIIILCAANNKCSTNSIPAKFSNVIGVGRGIKLKYPYYSINRSNNIQLLGDVSPEFVLCRGGRYKLFAGTSKATPKMINFIQKESISNFIELEKCLQKEFKIEDNMHIVCTIKNYKPSKYIQETLHDITRKYKGTLELREEDTLWTEFVENKQDIDLMLHQFFDTLNLDVDLLLLNYYDFSTKYRLCQFVEKRIQERRGE